MERLDYRINEDGIERWVSRDKALNIVAFLYPALWEEIDQKMRFDDQPFEYTWAGKKCRIEYKGPKPGSHKVANLLTSLFLLCLVVGLSGCKGGLASRVFGPDTGPTKDNPHVLNVVACCQDNDGNNNLSWPSFLPASHVELCKRVHTACYNNDCQINGETWLDMGVDCGTKFGHIGSEYYAGHSGY